MLYCSPVRLNGIAGLYVRIETLTIAVKPAPSGQDLSVAATLDIPAVNDPVTTIPGVSIVNFTIAVRPEFKTSISRIWLRTRSYLAITAMLIGFVYSSRSAAFDRGAIDIHIVLSTAKPVSRARTGMKSVSAINLLHGIIGNSTAFSFISP